MKGGDGGTRESGFELSAADVSSRIETGVAVCGGGVVRGSVVIGWLGLWLGCVLECVVADR